ncbi:MAG TPA: hypothetical protein VNT79_03160 [Phycisphaerae bacterium]|nr:hypothetical protein [Phycisphaerae bacterium]
MTELLIASMFFAAAPKTEPERPPELTFEKHVDYMDWYIDLVSAGKTDNAFEDYDPFTSDQPNTQTDRIELPPIEKALLDELPRASPWNAKDQPGVAHYLREHKDALDLLAEASGLENYWIPIRESTPSLWAYAAAQPSTLMRTVAKAIVLRVAGTGLPRPEGEGGCRRACANGGPIHADSDYDWEPGRACQPVAGL